MCIVTWHTILVRNTRAGSHGSESLPGSPISSFVPGTRVHVISKDDVFQRMPAGMTSPHRYKVVHLFLNHSSVVSQPVLIADS